MGAEGAFPGGSFEDDCDKGRGGQTRLGHWVWDACRARSGSSVKVH